MHLCGMDVDLSHVPFVACCLRKHVLSRQQHDNFNAEDFCCTFSEIQHMPLEVASRKCDCAHELCIEELLDVFRMHALATDVSPYNQMTLHNTAEKGYMMSVLESTELDLHLIFDPRIKASHFGSQHRDLNL